MTEDASGKTQRFVDALDDTLPKLRFPKGDQVKGFETAARSEHQQEAPPTLNRFLHLMAALLVVTLVPSQIVGPLLGHLNGSAPITNTQLLGVTVQLGVFAVFVWSWIQFSLRNKG